MRVRVRYFAAARDAAGLADEDLVVDPVAADVAGPVTVKDVRRALLLHRPSLLRVLAQSRIAVDQRFAAESDPVTAGAEIAVIPPVAGG